MANSGQFVTVKCFNPLKKSNHTIRDKRRLRNVTDWMCSLYPEVPENAKICDYCRKEIAALKNENASSSTHQDQEARCDSDEDPTFQAESQVIETLNASLQELGESPIDKKKIMLPGK